MNRKQTLYKALVAIMIFVGMALGHQAMAADKTVTYTISYTGTNTIVLTPNAAGFDGSSAAITGPAISESSTNFGLFLHDNLQVSVNLYNYGGNPRMYVSNNGITFDYAATINVACSSYYIKHIAMKDKNGTAITVFDPSLPPQEQTNFSFDLNVDIDKVGASGAPSTVTDYHVRTANSPTTIKTITITYGESPRNYTISYTNAVNGQNGVSNSNKTSYNVTTATFTITAPTRTGYTFNGMTYTDSQTPSATAATLPMTISRGEAATRKAISFNALWTANTYTVTLDNQSATIPGTTSVTATFDATMPTITVPTKTGYTFAGYYTETNGGGTQYYNADGSSAHNWNIAQATTLYAQWTPNTYTVTLDNQSATPPGTASVTATYDAAMPAITVPTKTGYTFGGYYTSTNGGGTQYYNADGSSAHNWDILEATTLYAQWTANTYTVHFDANATNGIDATGTMSNQSLTYDQGVLTANAFTRIGYTFANWNTEADGSGTTYTNQQTSPNITDENGATVTLYAQWNVINWGEGDGTSEDSPFVIRYASQLIKLSNDVNGGNVYDGKYFKLGNNIDMNGVAFDGIGDYNHCFKGNFNGDGKTVSNVTVNKGADPNVGFFGYVRNGTVRNLILDGVSINGGKEVGALVGYGQNCRIENCFVINSSVIYHENFTGIICGQPDATLTDNYYHNCSITKGPQTFTTNIGVGNSSNGTDRPGAYCVHKITVPEQVSVNDETIVINGVSYALAYTPITLIYNGSDLISASGDITLTPNGNGTYTFTMPANDVIIWVKVTITYIDADGSLKVCTDYTYITGETTGYDTPGWYVVMGDVEMESLTFNSGGNFHLILCDGAHLHLTKRLYASYSGVNLNIYAQSGGSGTLTVNNTTDTHHHAIDIHSGTFTLNGGIVNCTYDATGGSKYGLYAKGVVVNGGSLTAISTGYNGHGIFINGGDLTVNGGTLTARCTHSETGYGIYFQSDVNITFKGGNVTASGPRGGIYKNSTMGEFLLGWTNATDSYCVSSYVTQREINIQEPQVLWNGEEALYGTVDDFDLLDGKTLVPCVNSIYVNGFGGVTYSNYNWIFIASPVAEPLTPSEVTNLVANPAEHYDFYRLNPSNTMWENIKANTTENHPDFTSLVNGRGYLYANYYDILLTFPGTLNTATEQDVPVSKGYNLVGNPFGVPAYLSQSYYTLNELGYNIEPVLVSDAIMPCTGVIVQAAADGYVHFSTTAPTQQSTGGNKGSLNIALTQSNTRNASTTLDNAIITFSEGSALGKFYFGEQDANIYLTQGNEEYAIAYSEDQGEMPLNFKATKNGEYTLSFNTEGLELGYLHLIDNLTGNDIDLLQTPSYTFDARTTDYASRFKLVFSNDNNDINLEGNDNFAFIDSNGNIIINGSGMVQIIDVTGRILVTRNTNDHVGTEGLNAGVYVLRLINGDNVKTQKIVVK